MTSFESLRSWARPGRHRVPADLVDRPPAHRAGAARLGRSGRGLHGGPAARLAGGGDRLLPAASWCSMLRAALGGADRPVGHAARARRAPAGLPDRRARSRSAWPALLLRHAIEGSFRSLWVDRHRADRGRAAAGRRSSGASPRTTATSTSIDAARRDPHRLRAGARAHSRACRARASRCWRRWRSASGATPRRASRSC